MAMINPEKMFQRILESVEEQIIEESESLIQDSVRKFEAKLRGRFGAFMIATLKHSYNMSRDGVDLVIHVRGIFDKEGN